MKPLQLQGPGVGLQHLCLVAVEALRADPQPHGEPGGEVGALQNIWFDKQFASNLGTREMLYEKFEEIARERGWQD